VDQIDGVLTKLGRVIRPFELDDEIFVFDVAQIAQAGEQRFDPGFRSGGGALPR